MFGYALKHPKVPASNGIMNAAGLTPLTLSCKLARTGVFREMLELSAREFWRYSNITCSAYPLSALDTLLPDGRTSTCEITNWHWSGLVAVNNHKTWSRGVFRDSLTPSIEETLLLIYKKIHPTVSTYGWRPQSRTNSGHWDSGRIRKHRNLPCIHLKYRINAIPISSSAVPLIFLGDLFHTTVVV